MASRLEREFDILQTLFDRATAPQAEQYKARRSNLLNAAGSPAWVRERDALAADFRAQTSTARALLEKSEAEISEDGELSEETSHAWDALIHPVLMLEAAE